MNKAFTKEDETDAPAMVPLRASLPPATPNYVTTRGLERLRAELVELDAERAHLDIDASDAQRARIVAHFAARRSALEDRLATATLVDATKQPRDEVRFGARVEVRTETGESRAYKIVGVDEAEPSAGLLAFVSPLARALLGRKVGEVVTVRTPRGEDELEVVGIEYDA